MQNFPIIQLFETIKFFSIMRGKKQRSKSQFSTRWTENIIAGRLSKKIFRFTFRKTEKENWNKNKSAPRKKKKRNDANVISTRVVKFQNENFSPRISTKIPIDPTSIIFRAPESI